MVATRRSSLRKSGNWIVAGVASPAAAAPVAGCAGDATCCAGGCGSVGVGGVAFDVVSATVDCPPGKLGEVYTLCLRRSRRQHVIPGAGPEVKNAPTPCPFCDFSPL